MGCKRRAGDRFAPSSYEEDVARQTEHRWDTPRKCAWFGSDEPDSMTSASDVVETQDFGLPRDGYSMGAQSGLFIENDSPEAAWSPSKKLEDAVAQLQRDIADYQQELRFGGGQGPANPPRPMKRSGFTSTPVPRYSEKSSWEQYRQVFVAIVCSNGWDGVTAALQLLSHLDGDALNVALLMPESQRVIPGVLIITVRRGGWLNTSVSSDGLSAGRMTIRRYSRSSWRHWLGGRFPISTLRYSCRWCEIDSLMDRLSVHCDNISIVSDPILQCRTLWTVVVCGKVITMVQAGIHHGRFTR